MPARKPLLLALPLTLASCGGAREAAPTARTVLGSLPKTQASTESGACHAFAAAGSTGTTGPSLDKLAADAKKANRGSLRDYVHESIVDPAAYLTPGYQNLMPASFGQSLKPQQLADLEAFLVSGQKH